jgi:hypothetical protein
MLLESFDSWWHHEARKQKEAEPRKSLIFGVFAFLAKSKMGRNMEV